MEFSWELRKEFSLFFIKVYLIYFLSFSQIQSLLIGFCFWWVSTSGCCFSKDKQHRTRISVSEWGLRRNFSILDLPLYFRASFFSLNGALSDLQQEKRGSLGEKLGFLFFQENWLEFSWVPFYCRSPFFIFIKKGFFPLELFLEGNLPCSVPF